MFPSDAFGRTPVRIGLLLAKLRFISDNACFPVIK